MLCFLPEHCARGGTRRVCPCERGSVHVCRPLVRSTVREGLNLPVWSRLDHGMLCFLPERCARGCARRVCTYERGSVHVCIRCLRHCARGIDAASVEWAGPQNALISCPSNARGVAHAELWPCKRGSILHGAAQGMGPLAEHCKRESVRGQPAGRGLPVVACGPTESDGWPETPMPKGKKRGRVKV